MEQLIAIVMPITIITLVVITIRSAVRRQKRFRQEMQRIGYTALEHFDPSLQEKLVRLLRKNARTVRFRNIYSYSRMNFTFYRFEVYRGNNDNHPAYAVVARNLHLPRFAAVPKIDLPGILGKLWKKMLQHIAGGRDLTEIQMAKNKQFSDKYLLFATDPDTVYGSIPDSAWGKLAALPKTLMLDVVDDLIVFQELIISAKAARQAAKDPTQQLKAAADLGDRIYSCLRDARPVERSFSSAEATTN